MSALLLFLLLAERINFYVEPVIYRSTIEMKDTITQTTKKENIFYIEFNISIPYYELHYEKSEGINIARAIVVFKLSNLNQGDSLIDTLYRQFTISSFKDAARQKISFIIQFGLHAPEGSYRYKINIQSGDKKGTVENEIAIEKRNYRISDILLATDITSDTLDGYLRKGDLKVSPQPSHQFSEQYSNLYFYYEIYDIAPDSNKLNITYKIKNKDGKMIRKVSQQIDKKFEAQAVNLGIGIQGFEPGEYTLSIEMNDPEIPGIVKKETSFEITKIVQEEVSYEGLPYYDKIEYFLSVAEYKYFRDMPEQGKRSFLNKFWSTHNYYEIAERFEYADKHYRQGNKPGYETNRGEIHIKYGLPDEIERSTIEIEESKPYEHWQYFNGFEFVFVDIRGTNEYTLIWTNVKEERSQPTLYRYLPRSIKERIE